MDDLVDEKELLTFDEEPAEKPEPKKRRKGMDDKEFQAVVFELASDAANYRDEIAPLRAQATNYYKGLLPDIDKDASEEDRSRAVLTEVRDTVLGIMPDLLRVFFGADGTFSFAAVPAEDPEEFARNEKQARAATDYVRDCVLVQDNPDSFITFYDAFQDALVRKTGFLTWRWQKSKKPEYNSYTGLDEQSALALAAEEGVEVTRKRIYPSTDTAVPGAGLLYDLTLKRVCDYGKVRVQAVPCENMIVSRRARSHMDESPCIGYSEDKTLSEWKELGYSEAALKDHIQDEDRDLNDSDGVEQQAREVIAGSVLGKESDPPFDKSQRKIKYTELYIRADRDGDGIAELVRVTCVGTTYKVIDDEPCDDVQYAAFCPFPEAHQFFGESVADLTMDIQRINSRIVRDMLDSLAQSVTPSMGVLEGQVNLDDVLNPDASKIIRQRQRQAVEPIIIPFVGKEAMPVLDFMKNTREARTGMSDASAGLDPKALQSTDPEAVQATLTKGAARIEMIARVFAETGMKRLARGILKLLCKHQDIKRPYTTMGGVSGMADPALWSPDMDVRTTVQLGRGSPAQQAAFLQGVLAKQEQILGLLGPDNPFCSMTHYRYTLAKIVELNGWRNVESFFADPAKFTEEQKQQIAQALQAQKQGGGQAGAAAPDPATEQAKIASQEKIKMAELQFKQLELQTKTHLEGMRIQMEAQMRSLEIEAEHQKTMDQETIKSHTKLVSDNIKAETQIIVEQLKPRGGSDTGEKSGASGSKQDD